ncbi:GNAT superfamily N-acetyltransferase [Ottowia thiooxydans]|uniref:GNAT superfamily N-acetyltransferase n=2 Tax=Ottowia thiooxydans TaxID=219182 RepID=A0ABV2QEI3_9BURK
MAGMDIKIVIADPSRIADVALLLEEYFTAQEVVKRDSIEDIARSLNAPGDSSWLAEVDGVAAGYVALRQLDVAGIPAATALECKRLYVRPEYRGQGIAGSLLDAMELHAKKIGVNWIYLDSKDDLRSALRIYEERGYLVCDRYNDNPQATVFMRKHIV